MVSCLGYKAIRIPSIITDAPNKCPSSSRWAVPRVSKEHFLFSVKAAQMAVCHPPSPFLLQLCSGKPDGLRQSHVTVIIIIISTASLQGSFNFNVAFLVSSSWCGQREREERGAETPGSCLEVRYSQRSPVQSLTLSQRQDGFRGNRRQSRVHSRLLILVLQQQAGHLPFPGAWCVHNCALRLPRKPALRVPRPPGGEGVRGAGKAVADPFLDHVAASYNQSAEVGVHPEDPAGAPGKWWGGTPRSAGILDSACVVSPVFARSEARMGSNDLQRGPSPCLFQSRLFPTNLWPSGSGSQEPRWTWTPKAWCCDVTRRPDTPGPDIPTFPSVQTPATAALQAYTWPQPEAAERRAQSEPNRRTAQASLTP